jgi:hypothetical protein
MISERINFPGSDVPRGGSGATAAGLLSLAAAPTFAIMALVAGSDGGVMPEMLCSATRGSMLTGMAPMYVLMSAFHLGPWLRLLSGWRR